jgi:hypothetical protein
LLLHNRLSFDSDKTVFNLDRGVKSTANSDEIRDPLIRSIKSLEALETYAKNLDDFQLRGKVKLIRGYAHAFFPCWGRTTISHNKRLKLNVNFLGNRAFVTLRAAFLDAEMIQATSLEVHVRREKMEGRMAPRDWVVMANRSCYLRVRLRIPTETGESG